MVLRCSASLFPPQDQLSPLPPSPAARSLEIYHLLNLRKVLIRKILDFLHPYSAPAASLNAVALQVLFQWVISHA